MEGQIPFQRKGGPYKLKAEETPMTVSCSVWNRGREEERFTHSLKPGYDEEERTFSYVAALDYVAGKLAEKSPEFLDVQQYQQEYYAPEKQMLSVWLQELPEKLAERLGQELISNKGLEKIYTDKGLIVTVDKAYKDESRFHLTAGQLCDRKDRCMAQVMEPKQKLLKDMEKTQVKGMSRGD